MMKAKIIDIALRAVLLIFALILFFWWNNRQVEQRVKAECELKSVQQVAITTEAKQREVENVAKAKAVIHSRPNATRHKLLTAMHNGKL